MTRDRIISYRFYCRFLLLLVKCTLLHLTWKDSPTALLLKKITIQKMLAQKQREVHNTHTDTVRAKERQREWFNLLPHLQWNNWWLEWCGDWKTISYKRFHCIQFSISWLRKFQRNWLCAFFILFLYIVCLFVFSIIISISSIIVNNK